MLKRIAFVTYNTLGIESGWHDGTDGRRALVLQNTKGEGSRDRGEPIGAENRREQLGLLWGELQRVLPELDHVVIYLGTRGSERAIALAGQLPSSKVAFVSCDCGLSDKEILIQAAGLIKAGRVLCECGGHRTMERLIREFLSGEGELQLAA